MSKQNVVESDKKIHIEGKYLIIVALIGLAGTLGGYFLNNKSCKEYCKPGGLWTSASYDMEILCNVFEKKDSFNIQLLFNGSGAIYGKGKLLSGAGTFIASDFDMENSSRKQDNYEGEISLQGCNNLSISFWEKSKKKFVYTYSFVRGTLENNKIKQGKE